MKVEDYLCFTIFLFSMAMFAGSIDYHNAGFCLDRM